MKKNMLMNAALSFALLSGASSVSAEDPDPSDNDTGFQEEHGTYPFAIDGVSAVLDIEDTYSSVTAHVEGPAAENWHMIVLWSQCDGGAGPDRAIVYSKTSTKVTCRCPNPDPKLYPPQYFIEVAEASLTDVDDSTFDPDAPRATNSLLCTVEQP